jgi:hypothetical protein
MTRRAYISTIVGGLWVALLVVVLCTPVHWPIHEGSLSSSTPAVHPATGVSVDSPFLCVAAQESLVKNRYTSHYSEGYLAEDAQIDSLVLADRSAIFGSQMCYNVQNLLRPLLLSADSVHPQEGWSVELLEENVVKLRHEDGSTVSYTYSYLPQQTTVYYSGEKRGNVLEIDEYDTENYNFAYAIATQKGELETSYSLYRDGLEGKLARIALFLFSVFAGLLLFCLYQKEISAWIRLGRTQKKENDTEGS